MSSEMGVELVDDVLHNVFTKLGTVSTLTRFPLNRNKNDDMQQKDRRGRKEKRPADRETTQR